MPQVSVVIPYYNSAGTIIKALDSVVGQIYTDFEIILVDDGSNDNTHSLVDDYIKQTKRINFKHFYQENAGPADARNRGISKSGADLIAFLDADDSWISTKLAIQIKIMAANNIDLLGSNINIVEPMGEIYHQYYTKKQLEYVSFYKLLFKHYFYTSSVIVSKKVLEHVGGFPEGQKYAEDTLLFCRITRICRSAVSSDFLVNVYKPLFGQSGLSANLKETNKYVLNNFAVLRNENAIGIKKIGKFIYYSAVLFSRIKYVRKILISFFRKI